MLSLSFAHSFVCLITSQSMFPDALLPESRGRKAQGLVPSPSNGSRSDNGAVSALYREKKKADHTLHDHTFHEYLLFSVWGSTNLCRSQRVACQTCLMP